MATNCVTSADRSATCNSSIGDIRIATTTEFSDAFISSQITPLESGITRNKGTSETNIASIARLIDGVTGSNSTVFDTVDIMVRRGDFHTSSTDVQTQMAGVQNSIGGRADDAITAWQTSTDPAVGSAPPAGWCNVTALAATTGTTATTPPAVTYWANKWKIAH